MIATLRRFFKFCSEKNRKRFYIALVLSIVAALLGAMKYPAMGYILMNFINGTINKKAILTGFLIMTIPLALEATLKGFATMLQCRGGYGECADKRIHIAEHLRFIPMGYFNENSLGQITSVTTNTMEALGDVATRVVMVTTQGILGTTVIMPPSLSSATAPWRQWLSARSGWSTTGRWRLILRRIRCIV